MANNNDEEREGTASIGEELPLSARLIINYLEFEHLINNKLYVTFKEIVDGTGLGIRTARSAINLLRKRGLLDTYLDVKGKRRHMYKLNFKNLTEEKIDVTPGLYVIDVGIGTLPSMTFRIYRVLRASAVAFYTDNVPTSYLEFTKCTCTMQRLANYEAEGFMEIVNTVVNNGGSVSLVMDSLLDADTVKPYLDALYNFKENGQIMVYRVIGVSPIQAALELLLMGREDSISYRRDGLVIRIMTARTKPQLRNYLKIYVLTLREDGLVLRQYNENEEERPGEFKAYIIYSKA